MSHLFYPDDPYTRPMTLPVTLYAPRAPGLHASSLWYEVALACEPWNKLAPVFNLYDHMRSDTYGAVLWGDRTWVDWKRPGSTRMPTVYVQKNWPVDGPDSIRYWLPHELGHLIGLADHIRPTTPRKGYQNPMIADHRDPYEGVMSYRSLRYSDWFKDDDRDMLHAHWPEVELR